RSCLTAARPCLAAGPSLAVPNAFAAFGRLSRRASLTGSSASARSWKAPASCSFGPCASAGGFTLFSSFDALFRWSWKFEMSSLKEEMSRCWPICEPALTRSAPSSCSVCSYCAFVTGFGWLPQPASKIAHAISRRDARNTGAGTLPALLREAPSWGTEPVPERPRVLGTLDTTLLWTNLGIPLLVLVLPAYFDLPLNKALAATVVGAVIGNGMLAGAAVLGARAGVPTRGVQRRPPGRRGPYVGAALSDVR